MSGLPWLDVDTPKEVNKILYGEAGSIVSAILDSLGEVREL